MLLLNDFQRKKKKINIFFKYYCLIKIKIFFFIRNIFLGY